MSGKQGRRPAYRLLPGGIVSPPVPAAPLRILLVRFSAIGDVLLTTPLIRALRTRYPWAYLAAATKRQILWDNTLRLYQYDPANVRKE